MRVRTYLFVTLFAATTAMAQAAAAQDLPKPAGRVNDFAAVIDSATKAEIDSRLDQLEQKTTAEIAVATITSLDGLSIDEYANRLFKEWGVGQGKQDNGVLIVVAPNEREMRIEVGYGLEGVLPDGLAGQIIRDDFTPRFRDGDYAAGIRDGVSRVADVVEKQQVLTPEQIAALNQSEDDFPVWALVPFFGLFVTIGFAMMGIGVRTKTGFPLLFGSFFGGMPLLMSMAFIFTVSLFTLLPWALVMFLTGYRLAGREKWRDTFRGRNDDSSSGGSSSGWTMGTSSSSRSSGSSGSSSSFGGGSSGGGGASGKW